MKLREELEMLSHQKGGRELFTIKCGDYESHGHVDSIQSMLADKYSIAVTLADAECKESIQLYPNGYRRHTFKVRQSKNRQLALAKLF